MSQELTYDARCLLALTPDYLSYRPNKNYPLDGGDWQHLVYEDFDGPLHVEETRQ